MKKMVLIVLLLTQAVLGASISDYPYIFVKNGQFDAIYVIGDEAPSLDVVAATELSTNLAKYPNVTTKVGTSRVDSEIADIRDYNAIIIGSPCELRSASFLQGDPNPCYKNLAASTGHIRLYEHNGKYQLLISGITEKDRSEAVKYLARQSLSGLTGKTHAIPTGTGSTPDYYNRTVTQTKKNTQVTTDNVVYTPSEPPQTSAPVVEVKQETSPEDDAKKVKEQKVGEYEPLRELPEKKSILAKFWDWLTGLFG